MLGQTVQVAGVEACPKWLCDLATHKRLREQCNGRNPALVREVCEQVRDQDASVRLNAARSLGSIAQHGDMEIIETLLGCDSSYGLNDASSSVRAAAAESLGEIARGCKLERASAMLLARFGDPDWTVRSSALNALVRISGPNCAEEWLLDRLLESLNNESWSCVTEAAEALGRLAPKDDKRVVQSLTNLFSHPDWAVRKSCATAVARVAELGNRNALSAILPLLDDADWRVRKAALAALPEIVERGCNEGVNAVLRRLDDREEVGRKQTLDIISLQDEDVQVAALCALSRVSVPGDARVLAALAERRERSSAGERVQRTLEQTMAILQRGREEDR
mmetsp:Transcript_16130/g.33171  ORF Transcript_16130/g.33171 Transcript_16130/m.33171 type:complete len:336 (-) Transcript_16130:81-1088(-)